MSILWFIVGVALGFVFIGLQWLQVKNIDPCKNISRTGFLFGYILRLMLFVIVASFALLEKVLYGLVMFAGFWITRSLLLLFIGSGRIRWGVRRNS